MTSMETPHSSSIELQANFQGYFNTFPWVSPSQTSPGYFFVIYLLGSHKVLGGRYFHCPQELPSFLPQSTNMTSKTIGYLPHTLCSGSGESSSLRRWAVQDQKREVGSRVHQLPLRTVGTRMHSYLGRVSERLDRLRDI